MKKIYFSLGMMILLAFSTGWYSRVSARTSKTIYVNPNGNDENLGSMISPFKTLSKGVSVLNPGDTLVVSGTFNLPLIISKSGTAEAPIIIIGDNAILDMEDSRDVGLEVDGDYVRVTGFEVIGAVSHGVLIGGKHIWFENSSVHNNLPGSYGTGNCDSTVSWGSGLKVMVGADDVLLRDNEVYENCGEGIGVTRGLNVVVDGNTVRDNFSVNIYIDNSPFAAVQNNTVSCTGIYLRDGRRPTGIALAEEFYDGWGAQRHDDKVTGNTVSGCHDGIVSFESKVDNNKLLNAVISGNTILDGIRRSIAIYSENENVVVKDNEVYTGVYVDFLEGMTLSNNWLVGTASPTPIPAPTATETPAPTPVPPTPTPVSSSIPSCNSPIALLLGGFSIFAKRRPNSQILNAIHENFNKYF